MRSTTLLPLCASFVTLALVLFMVSSEAHEVRAAEGAAGLRVPLTRRKRANASNRLAADEVDEHGADITPVDWHLLERQALHLETRYVDPANPDLQRRQYAYAKRWLDLSSLGIGAEEDDDDDDERARFAKEEDAISFDAAALRKAIPKSKSDTKSKSKSKAESKSKSQHKHEDSKQKSKDSKHKSKDSKKEQSGAKAKPQKTAAEEKLASNKVAAAAPAPAAASAKKASVALKDVFTGGMDQEFMATVTVGTPGKAFQLVPDSGSSDTWMVSSECGSENCSGKGRAKYDPGASSTYRGLNKKFTLAYGIGHAGGQLFRDVVTFPTGAGGNALRVNTTLGRTNALSSDWATDASDGILGLGFRDISARKTVPIYANLLKQHTLEQPVIGFAFGRRAAGTDARSEMLLGGTNPDHIDGEVHYYPVDAKGYWEFGVRGLSHAARKAPGAKQRRSAIVDTGTSLIALPAKEAKAFWEGIPGASLHPAGQYYTYPCSAKVDAYLETSDGIRWPIDPRDLNLGRDTKGSDRCVGGILVANIDNKIVLGLAFLKNVYSVLDRGQSRVGLAKVKF